MKGKNREGTQPATMDETLYVRELDPGAINITREGDLLRWRDDYDSAWAARRPADMDGDLARKLAHNPGRAMESILAKAFPAGCNLGDAISYTLSLPYIAIKAIAAIDLSEEAPEDKGHYTDDLDEEEMLELLKCPDCGATKTFYIRLPANLEIVRGNEGEEKSERWGSNNKCHCGACGFLGKVREFLPETDPLEDEK
jgi:hypothetical protein